MTLDTGHWRERLPPLKGKRVLIYSHDTFGLGHLRRSRAIANAIVEGQHGASVLIISGSPFIGNFDFGIGVDYIRIPGVTKLPDGSYKTLNLNVSLEDTIRLRKELIFRTAEAFRPDIMIVDKEPTGFHGEILQTLEHLHGRGCHLVLGIRDVMDEPALLLPEWERKGATGALLRYYDEIWVYGLQEIYQPLAALNLPRDVQEHITYTGYLRRSAPLETDGTRPPKITKQPFILVTTGGGGDGDDLIERIISAYEVDPTLDLPSLIVFGPFINRDRRRSYMQRIAKNPKLDALTFDNKIEILMQKAAAVVAMGGYNTFCEILSFDKRALIMPRTHPRLEQHIRAAEAERLGLITMLSSRGEEISPERVAAALHDLPLQPRPSEAAIPGMLDGLDWIRDRFRTNADFALPAFDTAAGY